MSSSKGRTLDLCGRQGIWLRSTASISRTATDHRESFGRLGHAGLLVGRKYKTLLVEEGAGFKARRRVNF